MVVIKTIIVAYNMMIVKVNNSQFLLLFKIPIPKLYKKKEIIS